MEKVREVFETNQEKMDEIFIHLTEAKKDKFDPLTITLWEGWLKDIPDEYMEYEVVRTGQSLKDMEMGIMGFYLEIKSCTGATERTNYGEEIWSI